MKVILLISLIGLAASSVHYEFLEEWNLWKGQHGKSYGYEREDLERHIVWLSNKKYIEQHNANTDIFGFTLAMNHFGDMTDGEFLDFYGRYKTPDYISCRANVTYFKPKRGVHYQGTLDWRAMNAVTEVKDQASCGSSYAFSTTGSLEGAIALSYGVLVSLSEQNIVDCSVYSGNHGCYGGNMYNSFWYIVEYEGVPTESNYPYTGMQSTCNFTAACALTGISGIVLIRSGNESHLKAAVATVGPVSVAVDTRPTSFRFYSSGVYSTSQCSSTHLTHAMLVVGYGTNTTKDYWLVKNSWGAMWGDSGYIMMTRNGHNQCGIASDASYPTL